jgi:hypothetical protein
MEHAAVSDITLALVHERLIPGEQIMWAGKPEPTVPLPWISKLVVPLAKLVVVPFAVVFIFAIATGNFLLSLALPFGLLVCAWAILGPKVIRAMPVEHEEYVLTNWRAFSHYQSNGTRIVGEMLLDGNTLIQKRRCGHGTTTLVFSRSQKASEQQKVKGLSRACVALLNLRDAEHPMRLVEWAVATNPAPQTPTPPMTTNLGQAWIQN